MTNITIAIDAQTESALDQIAAAEKRTTAEIAAEALAACVRDQAELEEMVREAREDFAAGRSHSQEEVAARMKAIIEAARSRNA